MWALRWFARIEADTDLQVLKRSLAAEGAQPEDHRAERAGSLRNRPVSVMPFENLDHNEAAECRIALCARWSGPADDPV